MIEKLVRLSAKAYSSEEAYKCGNESYLFIDSHDGLYIAFAGSDDAKDWLENFDISPKSVNGIKVHSGFWEAMEECYGSIISKLKAYDFQNRKLYITGHSKGGALGFCLRLKLAMEGYDQGNIHFVGFATPRVIHEDSAQDYCQHYNNNVTLCEVDGDPVPYLPRKYMHYVTLYNDQHFASAPWYLKLPIVRFYLHKIKVYLEKFG